MLSIAAVMVCVGTALYWGLRDDAGEVANGLTEAHTSFGAAPAPEPVSAASTAGPSSDVALVETDELQQSFAVQVDDAGGGPVPGATVQVQRFRPHFVRVTETDDSGHAEASAPMGPFMVLVSAEGYLSETRGLAGHEDQHFKLIPAARVEGQVVDAQGRGVAIKVRLGSPRAESTTSGEDGRFVFESVRPGRYRPYVKEAQRLGEARPIVVTPGASITGVRIQLEAASAILVELKYDGGAPCPDPWLDLTRRPGTMSTDYGTSIEAVERAEAIEAGTPSALGLTEGELRAPGSALCEGLRPGRYGVKTRCQADEEGIPRSELQLRRGQLVRLAFRHPRTGRIDGRVVDAQGHPFKDATLRARGAAGEVAMTPPRYDGSFAFVLPPGSYQVWAEGGVRSPAKGPEQTVEVQTDGITQVEFTLNRLAELRVVVRRPDGKSAGESIRVDVQGPSEQSTWTTRQGRADFRLESGRYHVTASEADHKVEVQVDLPPEGAEIGLVLEDLLPKCAGVVVDAEGAPVADARVLTAFDQTSRGLSEDERRWLAGGDHADKTKVSTDLAGHFEVRVAHRARRWLWARAAKGVGRGVCEGTAVTIRLAPATGRLTVRGGDPGASVHVVQTDGAFVSLQSLDPRGTIELEDLPAGDYAAVLVLDERTGFAEGSLREGEHLTLELSQGPIGPLTGTLQGPDGAPLPGEHLFMSDPIGAALGRNVLISRSDAQGRFSADPAPRWPVHLRVPGAKHCVPPTRWVPGDGPLKLRMAACVR